MPPHVAIARTPPLTHTQPSDSLRDQVRDDALRHMLRAVAEVEVSGTPFPHFIASPFLPHHIYQDLLANLPDPQLYQAFSYRKHATDGVSNRGRFALEARLLDRLPRRGRSLWLGVRDALGSPELRRAVFGRLGDGLAYRFGIRPDEAAALAGYAKPELFRETQGYTIKPHPDTRRKLVTMQIALPPDDSQRDLGTEFYRRSLNPVALLREPRGFDVVKRAPFLPNVAYAFVVLNTLRLKSWHGRTTLDGSSGVRNTILNIWYAKPEDGNPELVG